MDNITTHESMPIFILLSIGGTAVMYWVGSVAALVAFVSAGIIFAWCVRLIIRRLEQLIANTSVKAD